MQSIVKKLTIGGQGLRTRSPQANPLYHTYVWLVKRENEKILKNFFIPKIVKILTYFTVVKWQSGDFVNFLTKSLIF